MKTRYVMLSAVLTIALTLPLRGQESRTDTTIPKMKQSDMSGMMGKPIADATVDGFHMKVWLMSQEKHKAMMKGKMDPMKAQVDRTGEMGGMELQGMRNPGMAVDTDMKMMKHGDAGMKDTSMAMGKDAKGMQQAGKGIRDTAMKMDNGKNVTIQGSGSTKNAMMDAMTAGTHHIMLDVTNAANGKEVTDASAQVQMVSPSGKKSSVDLTPRMGHFGGALTLDEKGEYRFTVGVKVGGVTESTQFQYAVK